MVWMIGLSALAAAENNVRPHTIVEIHAAARLNLMLRRHRMIDLMTLLRVCGLWCERRGVRASASHQMRGARWCVDRTVRQFPSRSNSSHGPITVRLAIRGDAPAFSAVTSMLLTSARSDTLPSGLWMSWKVSHGPITVRLATREDAPAFSAVTSMPLALARSATLPLPASTMSNCWLLPLLLLSAISGCPPAVTNRLFACARRLIEAVPTRSMP